MYVIKFEKNKNLSIDYNESFSIFNGLTKLREWNKEAKSSQESFMIQYKIIDEAYDNPVLMDRMALGTEFNLDFFEVTRNRLKHLFNGEELESNLTLLEAIESQYQVEKDKYYANLNIEIHENIITPDVKVVKEEEKESKAFKETKKIKKQKSEYSTPEKKRMNKEQKSPKSKATKFYNNIELSKSKLLSLFGGGIVTVVILVLILPNLLSSSQQAQPFDTLIEERYFIKALEEYPHRHSEIVSNIVELGEDGIPFLEAFIDRENDYVPARLDLAYLTRDYEQVVELEEYANTDQRRAQVTIALINEGQLERAASLERMIQDNNLNQTIQEEYFTNVVENLTRNDMETAEEFREHANNAQINDYITSFKEVNEEINNIENLPLSERNGFFKSRRLDNLREQRSELLSQSTLYSNTNERNILSLLVPVIAIAIICMIACGIFIFRKKKQSNETVKEYDDLIKNNLFILALKQYPQKYPDIEREIFLLGEKGIPYLEEFIATKKGYKPALFDLKYLKKEYEKVIELEQYADTDGRKSQLAIAYIQTGKIDKANEINQYIEVPELDYYLNEHYYRLTVEALKNDDFTLAQEYQEKGNSTDINYLMETIKLIDNKISDLIERTKSLGYSTDEQIKMKKLEEFKAVSLNLD